MQLSVVIRLRDASRVRSVAIAGVPGVVIYPITEVYESDMSSKMTQ